MPNHLNLTFVIADDHPTIRKTVKDVLEGKGFRVVGEASDGVEAVRFARNWNLASLYLMSPCRGLTVLMLHVPFK